MGMIGGEEVRPFAGEDLQDPTGEGRILTLRNHTAPEVRRWLKVLCNQSGLWPTQLAKAAKVSPSAINKFLKGGDYKHTPTTTTLGKIYRAFEKNVPLQINGSCSQTIQDIVTIVKVPIVGAVEMGAWKVATDWPLEDRYAIDTVVKEDMGPNPFGLLVKGNSMDKKFPEGTILICANIHDVGGRYYNDNYVIVERHGNDGRIEATCKQLQILSDTEAWLCPRSDAPEYQAAIQIGWPYIKGESDPEIVLKAVVTGYHQPLPRIP